MKEYETKAKSELKEANQNVDDSKGGMAWLWVVLGLLFAVAISYFVWKCYCKKDEGEGDK